MSKKRAIEVNSLSARPFPVTVDFSVKENFYSVFLTPLSVSGMINLLPYQLFLIFNVESYEIGISREPSLAEIVKKRSAYLTKFDEDTLLMEKKQVVKLLEEVPHYNFCLIDAAKEIGTDKVIQIETAEEVFWKIFEGTFKKFVYREEMRECEFNLVYSKLNNKIKVEKVRDV